MVVSIKVTLGPLLKSKEARAIGQVGDELRSIHDMHGWNTRPPYKIDHADGLSCLS